MTARSGSGNEARQADEGAPLAPFGFLWAITLLYHQVFYRAVLASPLDAALTISAGVAMLWPGAVPALGVLAALHVATVLHHLPHVYNHWHFAGIVSLALLVATVTVWRGKRLAGSPAVSKELYAAFAPAGRASLALLYFLSGLHKLNGDFVTPGVSCASELYRALSRRLVVLPSAPEMDPVLIGLTLATELGLPVLLSIPRLRGVGIVVGLAFHLVMAAAGFPRFSAVGVALLALYLPSGALAWLIAQPTRVAVVAGLTLATVLWRPVADGLFLLAQVALTAGILASTLVWLRRSATLPAPRRPPGRRLAWAVMIGPALVLLSGAAPYLGLGTERAFAMYSNLSTEGGRSNHVLVPPALQVFSYQRDLVRVVESSAPRLQRVGEDGLVIPYAELRAILSEEVSRAGPAVSVSYVRDGKRHDVGAAERDATLGLPASPLAVKFLRFRAIESSGPRRCGV